MDPRVDLGLLGGKLLDTCGTGADRAGTFNVSTAAAFLLAAGDVPVAKHGNRSISSQCGSADVLEALGIHIELPPLRVREGLETLGIAFLYAPYYHKTFQTLQPIRQFLAQQGKRTIFNLLGPLVNPARPNIQVVGVYDPALTDLYVQVLALMKLKRAIVVHGFTADRQSGFDEFSTLGISRVSQLHSNGNVETFELDAATFGFRPATLADLQGSDAASNARIIQNLLSGKDDGPRRDLLVYNAAAGFVLASRSSNIEEGIQRALGVIASGAALAKLEACQAFTKGR